MAEALPTPLPQRPLIAAIRRAEAVLLYLDFDGTLVPIRQDPSRCQLSPPLRATLQQLSGWRQNPALDLAVISGRSLVDLRQRLGPDLRGLSLAGNHGLEIAHNGNVWSEPRAQALVPALNAVAERLQQALQPWPGAWLEHKGLSLSLHTRRLVAAQRQPLARQLMPLLEQIHAEGRFLLRRGRLVLEIRPAILHTKATAVQWLEAAAQRRGLWRAGSGEEPLRLYFGDDDTDEDVFRLWPGVVGVRVGPGDQRSAATYRLSGPAGVAQWLTQLAAA